jgi:hypothetical protein
LLLSTIRNLIDNYRLLHKKFHRHSDKINSSKTPQKIAKNLLKVYKGFKSDFDGWFKSFSDTIIFEIELALLGQYILYMLKAQIKEDDIIYDVMKRQFRNYNPACLKTYFGITNFDAEPKISEIVDEYYNLLS